MNEHDILRVLPRDIPDFHERQAAHLRALAATATTAAIKRRLLQQAEEHEQLIQDDVRLTTASGERG